MIIEKNFITISITGETTSPNTIIKIGDMIEEERIRVRLTIGDKTIPIVIIITTEIKDTEMITIEIGSQPEAHTIKK
jgi:hypothetical protein